MILNNALSGLSALLAKEDLTSGIFDGMELDYTTALRVVIAMAIGIVLASLWSLYDKRYLGSFVRKLLDEKCTSPDSAKTLYELGFDDKLGVRRALKSGNTYARWVVCVEREEYELEMQKKQEAHETAHAGEKKPPKFKEIPFREDPDVMHYYIPESKSFDAGRKFSAKGSNWLGIAIILIILAILLGVVIYALPSVFELLGRLAS